MSTMASIWGSQGNSLYTGLTLFWNFQIIRNRHDVFLQNISLSQYWTENNASTALLASTVYRTAWKMKLLFVLKGKVFLFFYLLDLDLFALLINCFFLKPLSLFSPLSDFFVCRNVFFRDIWALTAYEDGSLTLEINFWFQFSFHRWESYKLAK